MPLSTTFLVRRRPGYLPENSEFADEVGAVVSDNIVPTGQTYEGTQIPVMDVQYTVLFDREDTELEPEQIWRSDVVWVSIPGISDVEGAAIQDKLLPDGVSASRMVEHFESCAVAAQEQEQEEREQEEETETDSQ